MDTMTRKDLRKFFFLGARFLHENTSHLNELDAIYGDGDYGILTDKISHVIENHIDNWESNVPPKIFITRMGDDVLTANSGTAGPLWGTLVSGLGIPLSDEENLSIDVLKKMFNSSLEEVFEITPGNSGDKTFLDAYIPAVESISNYSGDSVKEMFEKAYEAAKLGCENTKNMPSKYGKAKKYGEKTIGTEDVGAKAIEFLFQGFFKSFK